MRSRRAHFRRIVATAVMLPLLVLATAFAQHSVRCKYTGEIVLACECPVAQSGEVAPCVLAIGAQDCCERQVVESLAARYEEGPTAAFPIPVRLQTRAELHPRPMFDRALWTLAAHRPKGRALVLLKQSFLI